MDVLKAGGDPNPTFLPAINGRPKITSSKIGQD